MNDSVDRPEAPVRSSRTPPAERKKKAKRKKRKPLWQRAAGAVVAAGALAGAVTAILQLWPDPDPVDRVTITSAETTPQLLSSYTDTLRIEPLDPDGNLLQPFAALPHPAVTPTTAPSPSRTTGPATSTTTGSTNSTSTSSTSGSRSVPTTSTSGGRSSSNSTSPTTTTSASTGAGLLPPRVLDVPLRARERLYSDMLDARALDEYLLPDRLPHLPGQIPFTIRDSVDEKGVPLPAEEAAKKLAARLSEVRSVPTPQGKDPLGVRLTVDLQMEGLRGQHLLLYWRLVSAGGPGPVPEDWARATPASRLTPGTDLDSAAVDTWVPLPKAPGPYQVDVLVLHEASQAPLASFRTAPFD